MPKNKCSPALPIRSRISTIRSFVNKLLIRPQLFALAVALAVAYLALGSIALAQETPGKAPPERTYSRQPFLHRIVLLDEDGTPIRPTKPGEEGGPPATVKPVSLAKTCGKCHSDYETMQHGWHFNAGDSTAPHGRPGEPWIWTDVQTRTQLPLSYRGWRGTFDPHASGLNDFNFARIFGRHSPGGGVTQNSSDLRFKMSGPLENDCLICHVSDGQYDNALRATQIGTEQNFKYAPTLAAFLGKVQGSAAKLKDNVDLTGADAKRAPKIAYDATRFDEMGQVVINLTRRVPNERCYFCHTNVDVGRSPTTAPTREGLESRWIHDGDIHLIKGMQCVDCHRNGADHMIVRGYEGESEDREKAKLVVDKTIATLSCSGCHYGTEAAQGGRNAAPHPQHKGLPTLHLERLSCTACHSGPKPADATALVQTAMAHKLGLPRHETVDTAAPTIQEPVFLRVGKNGYPTETESEGSKITPHRMIVPTFWGRLQGTTITPIPPDQVIAAGAGEILGDKSSDKAFKAIEPLTPEQIAQVLQKLASAPPPKIKPADAMGGTASPTTAPTTIATSQPTSQPTPAWAQGEPVFVTGMKMYQLKDGKLQSSFHASAQAYYWPIAHDVRGAQQALGAQGCTECHSGGAPVFNASVDSASLVAGVSDKGVMHRGMVESFGALDAFAVTYPLRPLLVIIGYAAAALLALVILKGSLRALGSRG